MKAPACRFVVACLLLLAIGAAWPAAAADLAAGQAKAGLCQDCHGTDGASSLPGIPHLAGQNEVYLAKQMREFREPMRPFQGDFPGVRKQGLMSHQAAGLKTLDIDNLAAWYASRACVPGTGPMPASVPKAVTQVCINCHGETGRANSPLIPNLAGQKADYLIEQLKLYRAAAAGQETYAGPKRDHPLMDLYAARYDDGEFRAVAAWYAAQNCR